jgi:hypothetical protein
MAAQWTSPGERWRLLAPPDAVVVAMQAGPLAVRHATARLRSLPAGTPVVLLDSRPGGRRRARRVTAAGALLADRQYVALPSLRRAIVVAEDSPAALGWACRTLVAPPPGLTWAHGLADAVIRYLRRRPALAGLLAAGRVTVGRTA